MDKIVIGAVIGAIVIGGGAFYGGMMYGKSIVPTRGQRGQFTGQGGQRGAGNGQRGGVLTAGEILSKDETSITIKMQDENTKIVLVGSSVQIIKSVAGTAGDLVVGTQVAVNGSANSDGSLTARSVQIRPAGPMPFGGPNRANQ
ncbi:MAG: hypothetical protein AAB947_02140 [Patescibacteria group bacterium]